MKQILLLQIPILFLALFTKLYMHQLQAHQSIVAECYTYSVAIRKQQIVNLVSNRRKRRAKVYFENGFEKIPYYEAIQKRMQSTGEDIWVRVIKLKPFQKTPKPSQKAI